MLSANLGGLSDHYLKLLNSCERDSCILHSGEDTTDIGKRIDATIECRSNNGGDTVTFGVSIDATKVSKVLEVSSGFQAIIGGEYPKHFMDSKGRSKDQVTVVEDEAILNVDETSATWWSSLKVLVINLVPL